MKTLNPRTGSARSAWLFAGFFGPRPKLEQRRLAIEPLEERRVLSVATPELSMAPAVAATNPWQNPTQRLDVNNDGFISPVDALIIFNRLNDKVNGGVELPPLGEGEQAPWFYDTSGDGICTPLDALQIFNALDAAQGGPVISQIGLANDTGYSASDNISNNLGVSGAVTVPLGTSSLVALRVSVDGSSSANLLSTMQDDGTFVIPFLNSQFADGPHTIKVTVVDQFGYTYNKTLKATLDTAAVTPGIPQLTADSDSGASDSDGITNDSTPTFAINAEPLSLVSLFADGQKVGEGFADSHGKALVTSSLWTTDGIGNITASIVDAAGNPSGDSGATTFHLLTKANVVLATAGLKINGQPALLPITSDLTPNMWVSATDATNVNPLPNGTVFSIDVDLNNNGSFDDPGDQLGNTTRTLLDGEQIFQLANPLPDVLTASYKFRARITDPAGNLGLSPVQSVTVNRTMSDTLINYVNKPDTGTGFTPVGNAIPGSGYRAYVLDLVSQHWRTAADFAPSATDPTVWQHYLVVIVPTTPVVSKTALIFINGGNTASSPPTQANFANGSPFDLLAKQAVLTSSIVINLPVVPREPITFADETTSRTEDEIIAYTYDKFLDEVKADPAAAATSDWPLLLPMVKSAVKAMDAAQEFVVTKSTPLQPLEIDNFVVSGGSKRGWTTWLTAAVDPRVKAIIPDVYDNLNIGAEMVHHYGVYGKFAEAILPYQDEQVFERILTAEGQELGKIVDPYRYLNNGTFDMPKLLINSADDQFFVDDSAQYYFQDLPGTKNYLRYIPNVGHGLDTSLGTNSQALEATLTFYNAIVNNKTLPSFSWTVEDDGSLRVVSETTPTSVKLWQATNPDARDFRQDFTTVTWTSSNLVDQGGGVYIGSVPKPALPAATGFFVELDYPSGLAIPGKVLQYKFTTQIVVSTHRPLANWPYSVSTDFSISPGVVDSGLIEPAVSASDVSTLALAVVSKQQSSTDAVFARASSFSSPALLATSVSRPTVENGTAPETSSQAAGTLFTNNAGTHADEQPSLDDLLFGTAG